MSTTSPSLSQPRPRGNASPAAPTRRSPPPLHTVAQVADHLGASTRHVRRLIDRGELPVHRLGRLVRISEDDVARLIAASRQAGR